MEKECRRWGSLSAPMIASGGMAARMGNFLRVWPVHPCAKCGGAHELSVDFAASGKPRLSAARTGAGGRRARLASVSSCRLFPWWGP
jgi:hypothetical protein